MADNINPPSGLPIRAKDVAGVLVPINIISKADGATLIDPSTSQLQETGNTSLAAINAKLPALENGGVPVTLPAGLASSDGQAAAIASTDAILAKLIAAPSTETTAAAILAKLIASPATETTLAAILAKLIAAPATETTSAAILAKLIAAPSTEATAASILAKLTADPATQTTSAAILAKLTADPATQTTLAAVQALLTALSKTEDAAHSSGDQGIMFLGVRSDSDAPLGADGGYIPFALNQFGRLKVSTLAAATSAATGSITTTQPVINTYVAGGSVYCDVQRQSNVTMYCTGTFAGINCTFEASIDSTTGQDGSWFAIQAIRTNANTIELTTGVLAAAPVYAWEMSANGYTFIRVRCTARTSGTQNWTILPGAFATEPIPGAQISGTQPVSGTVTATVTGGTVLPVTPTTTLLNSAATTNAAFAKASAGTVWSLVATNMTASAKFVKLFNLAVAPTVGTSLAALVLVIPPNSTAMINGGSNGLRFSTGIAYCITGAQADSDTTAVALGDVKMALSWT